MPRSSHSAGKCGWRVMVLALILSPPLTVLQVWNSQQTRKTNDRFEIGSRLTTKISLSLPPFLPNRDQLKYPRWGFWGEGFVLVDINEHRPSRVSVAKIGPTKFDLR